MALNVGELEAALRLKSDLERQLAAANAQLKHFGAEVSRAGGTAKSTSADLSYLESSVTKLGAAITIGAVARWVMGLAGAASHLQDLRERTNASLETLQRFQVLAEQNGTTVEAMSAAMFLLGRRIAEGDTSTVGALKALGLELNVVRAMGMEEAFRVVGSAVAGMNDPMQQATLGTQLMGRSVQDLLPVLARLKDETRSQIIMTDSQVDALAGLANMWTRLTANFTAALVATIDQRFGFSMLNDEIQALRGNIGDLPRVQGPATEGARAWTKAMQDRMAIAVADGLTAEKRIISELDEPVKRQIAAARELAAAQGNWQTILRALDGDVRNAVAGYLEAGVSQGTLADAYQLTAVQIGAVTKALQAEKELLSSAEAVHDLAIRNAQRIKTELSDTSMAYQKLTNEAVLKELDAQLKLAQAWGIESPTALNRLTSALAVLNATAVSGISTRAQEQVLIDEYTQALLDEAIAADQAAIAQGRLTDAKQAAIPPANQYTEVLSRMTQVMIAFGAGAYSFENVLSSLFQYYANAGQGLQEYLQGSIAPGGRLPGMAAGGPVSAGRPVVVGERGPELFVPRSAGAIVANGAGAVNVTVNVTQPLGTPAQIARAVNDALSQTLKAQGLRMPLPSNS